MKDIALRLKADVSSIMLDANTSNVSALMGARSSRSGTLNQNLNSASASSDQRTYPLQNAAIMALSVTCLESVLTSNSTGLCLPYIAAAIALASIAVAPLAITETALGQHGAIAHSRPTICATALAGTH
jgi:hypothetical protein